MPFINTPQTDEAITVNGTAAGYVGVTSSTNYYPGATVWLRGTATASKQYRVTDIVGNTIGLQEVVEFGDNTKNGPRYHRTGLTQWLVSDSARISQERCTVRVEDSTASVKVPV